MKPRVRTPPPTSATGGLEICRNRRVLGTVSICKVNFKPIKCVTNLFNQCAIVFGKCVRQLQNVQIDLSLWLLATLSQIRAGILLLKPAGDFVRQEPLYPPYLQTPAMLRPLIPCWEITLQQDDQRGCKAYYLQLKSCPQQLSASAEMPPCVTR